TRHKPATVLAKAELVRRVLSQAETGRQPLCEPWYLRPQARHDRPMNLRDRVADHPEISPAKVQHPGVGPEVGTRLVQDLGSKRCAARVQGPRDRLDVWDGRFGPQVPVEPDEWLGVVAGVVRVAVANCDVKAGHQAAQLLGYQNTTEFPRPDCGG